jgi:hypothetical protein
MAMSILCTATAIIKAHLMASLFQAKPGKIPGVLKMHHRIVFVESGQWKHDIKLLRR